MLGGRIQLESLVTSDTSLCLYTTNTEMLWVDDIWHLCVCCMLCCSCLSLCKLIQYALESQDPRLQDIEVQGDQIFGAGDTVKTRAKSRQCKQLSLLVVSGHCFVAIIWITLWHYGWSYFTAKVFLLSGLFLSSWSKIFPNVCLLCLFMDCLRWSGSHINFTSCGSAPS